MGWDFWRIEWPNAALLFALALTPFVAIFDSGTVAAQRPATEIVSDPGPAQAQLALANEQAQSHSNE